MGEPMIRVVVTDKHGSQRAQEFAKREVTIGRAEKSDLVLDDGTVSKYHARIVEKDEKLILVDLRSDSGVFVNRRRLRSPQVISAQDEIRIGSFLLKLAPDRSGSAAVSKGRVACPKCGGPLRFRNLADYCPACNLPFP